MNREEVLRSITVEAIARQYNITLPKKSNGVVRCPLRDHEDSKPSFSINFETGLWNCFGCGHKGDYLDLVAEMENLDIVDDFPEILGRAADIAGVSRDETAQSKRGDKRRYEKAWNDNKEKDLTAAASIYLAKKGVDISTLDLDIRPEGKDDFVVPVRDWRGEIIGLQRGTKMAMSESNVGGFFFENINRKETLYIAEGLSDYLTMIHCGFRNTIGLFSVNVPDKEIMNVLSDAHDIKLCLDYDHFDSIGQARGSDAGLKKTKAILQKVPHAKAYFASMTIRMDISDTFQKAGVLGVEEIFMKPGRNFSELERDTNEKITPSFDPRIIAEDIARRYLVATNDRENWLFTDGVWTEIPRERVEKLICDDLTNRGAPKSIFKHILEIKNYLRLETYERIAHIKQAMMQENLGEYIYFSDGKYDINTDKFSEYTPEDFVFSRIKSKFEDCGDSEPKIFINFLKSLFRGYKNEPAYIEFIQEWIGYCLFPKSPIHAFLYVYGTGGNGKGVLFNTIGSIVGHDKTINYNLSKLENDGERAIIQLFGRYVNLGTEEQKRSNLGSPVLKSLTGGDPVTGRRLYKEAFTFRPHTKMLLSSNYPPGSGESASNISRRLNLLHLKHVFDDGKTLRGDVGLEKKISEELPEITWWAIKGLKRLLKRGYFEKPAEMMLNEQKTLTETDPVASFLDAQVGFIFVDGKPQSLKDLYENFRMYCMNELGKSSRYVITRSVFVEALGKQGYTVYSTGTASYVAKQAFD